MDGELCALLTLAFAATVGSLELSLSCSAAPQGSKAASLQLLLERKSAHNPLVSPPVY